MAAQAWKFFNEAKRKLMDGTIDIDGATFKLALYKSAANLSANLTLSTLGSLANQVAAANGYAAGGKSCSTPSWTILSAGAPGTWKFTWGSAVIFSASGGNITSVAYGVIYAGATDIMCFSRLSTAAFDVTDGNTLTISPAAGGVFT